MIVAFGDSITAGQHATRSYADILGFHNAGVPGDTTEFALERFDRDVAPLKPKVVVIQFGHNDANVWRDGNGLPRVSLSDYQENLKKLVWRCHAIGTQPFIVGLYKPNRDSVYARRCLTYSIAALKAAAATHAPFISMWDFIDPTDLLPDGIHLTDAGHQRYAERIGWYTQPPSSTKVSISGEVPWWGRCAWSEVKTEPPSSSGNAPSSAPTPSSTAAASMGQDSKQATMFCSGPATAPGSTSA